MAAAVINCRAKRSVLLAEKLIGEIPAPMPTDTSFSGAVQR